MVWVESERRCGDRVSTEVPRLHFQPAAQSQATAGAVRKHWSIENAHHWVLDVAFGENGSRIRTGHAAHNMAILKSIAHNLLRQDTSLKVGIANKRLAAAWNRDYLCQLVGLKPKPI